MENLYKWSVYHSTTISRSWHPNPLRCHPDRSAESRLSAENRQLKTDNWLSGVTPCSFVTFTSIQHLSSQAVGLPAASPRAAAGFPLQSLTRAYVVRENIHLTRSFSAECPPDIYSATAPYNSANASRLLLISPERQRTDEVNLTRTSVSSLNFAL